MTTRLLSIAAMAAASAAAQSNATQPDFRYEFCTVCAPDLPDAIAHGDTVRLRRHAWTVFAGMTLTDAQSPLPVFLNWRTKQDLIRKPNAAPVGTRDAFFGMEAPTQLPLVADLKEVLKNLDAAQLEFVNKASPKAHIAEPLISKVLFNEDLYQHVRKLKTVDAAGNPIPVTDSTGHIDPAAFCALKKQVEGHSSSVADLEIPAFPSTAIAVKTAWWPVKAKGLTAVPVWDPESNSPAPNGNSPTAVFPMAGLWSRWVAVDPGSYSSKPYERVPDHLGRTQEVRVVPLSNYFYLTITTQEQADRVRDIVPDLPAPTVGDYVVLVGLHFTTKEIPDWIWATFWWHDRPDVGPYAGQRPSLVLSPWRNYLMSVSYSMTEPREPDGSPHIAFNPYLEGPLAGGITSNCMTCHRRAVWPAKQADRGFTSRTPVSAADPLFSGRMKLDFIWSLSSVAMPAGGCPAN